MIPPALNLRLAWLSAAAAKPRIAAMLRGRDEPLPPRWPVFPAAGKKLLKRRFQFAGCDVEMAGRILWEVEASDDWHRELNAFRWIQDVVSVQNNKVASSFVREFINGFITDPGERHRVAWEAEIAGERLSNWLYHRDFILRGGSQRFQARFVRALVDHIRCLYRWLDLTEGDGLLEVTKGLISAAVFLPHLKLDFDVLCEKLDDALTAIVEADGGHVSRAPERHLRKLQSLLEIAQLLAMAQVEEPMLEAAIERMGMGLRFFCHGDGRLGLFNDSLMGDALTIAHAIEMSDNGGEVPAHMERSGFFRLENDGAVILLAGTAPGRPPFPSDGSFEFSDGGDRFVVNCGGYRGSSPQWASVALSTAAHSNCSLDTEPHEPVIVEDEQDILEAPPPGDIFAEDAESLRAQTICPVHHDGIEAWHERDIHIARRGMQFSGRDRLRLDGSLPPGTRVTARFHLHPDIRCQRQKDGRLSLTSVSGTQWMFSSSRPREMALEESVYLGYYGKPQKTLQIAISFDVREKTPSLDWTFERQDAT